MTDKLNGKVAIVTGASSGIGEATALALAAEGARLCIIARRSDRLEKVAQKIANNRGEVMPIVADITDEAQVRSAIQIANLHLGSIDILINNAGLMLLGNIDGADTNEWRRMVNTNLLGLMYTTHAVLPFMKLQQGGDIVNISSVGGRMARAGMGVYNATKWGVTAFSEALRQEVYKHKIRITVIEPGAVATELHKHSKDSTAREESEKRFGMTKQLRSEDIAAAIVFSVTQPAHVNISELLLRPIEQEL